MKNPIFKKPALLTVFPLFVLLASFVTLSAENSTIKRSNPKSLKDIDQVLQYRISEDLGKENPDYFFPKTAAGYAVHKYTASLLKRSNIA